MPNENITSGDAAPTTAATSSKLDKTGKMVRQKPYAIAIVTLAIIAVAGIGFGIVGMVLNGQAQSQIEDLETIATENGAGEVVEIIKEEEKNVVVEQKVLTAKDLLLRGNKVLNGDYQLNYSLSSSDTSGAISAVLYATMAGTEIDCETSQKATSDSYGIVLSIDWDKMASWYGLEGRKAGYEQIKIDDISGERVVDVLVASFGQAGGYEVVFFLMDDGTVEYIPIGRAIREGFHSYGKIEGIEGVVRLKQVAEEPVTGCIGGGLSAIAQKANGDFYNLYSLMEAQHAWD